MGSVRVPAPAGPSLLSASTRSRGERRQRLSAWGRGAVKRLRHLGLDISGCDVDDGGLLFVPDGRLALTLDAGAVEVALVLPPSDLPALRTLLEGTRPLALGVALAALPEQFEIGASSDVVRLPAPRATAEDLHALLDRAEQEGGAVWLGWTVPREVASLHAATLDAQLQDALVALGQVLRLFARATEAEPGKAKRARRHGGGDEERDRGKPRARTRARERDREPDPERERERETEPESAADPGAPAPRMLRPFEAKPRLRASLVRRGVPRPGTGIDKGAKVRVLEGPFAGKEGLVQELDGNGGARVMLGLLAVRIDVNDLVSSAEGRGRPRLSSSHRRPMPVRS
jgi:hypothetical protein